MTLACLLLMQCYSMHMVPGGADHVWFIRCIHTYRPRAFRPAICIPEWRSLQSLTSSLAVSRGDRQTPGYRSVSADGRCGDLTQSEPRRHALWMEAHFYPSRRCRLCTGLYLIQRDICSHTWRFSLSIHIHVNYWWNTWLKCFMIYCFTLLGWKVFVICHISKTVVKSQKRKQY